MPAATCVSSGRLPGNGRLAAAIDSVFDEYGLRAESPLPVVRAATTAPIAHRSSPTAAPPTFDDARDDGLRVVCRPCAYDADDGYLPWWRRALANVMIGMFVVGFLYLWSWAGSQPVRSTDAAAHRAAPGLATKVIGEVQLGERVEGTNPIAAQAEHVVPEPATWRKINLHLVKEDGLSLWVELLRALEWIELYEAEVGGTIELDLPEMGAAGAAEVTAIEPCPPIEPGRGAIVTGKFTHESAGAAMVRLWLEGESRPTEVTAGHAYWSADRRDYVDVGELREGEQVDTQFGQRRVVAVERYTGPRELLFNLETTEHVFRVGQLGTLVHNSCADNLRRSMKGGGVYDDVGAVPHHLVPRGSYRGNEALQEAREILRRNAVDLDSHWNGVFLPSSRLGSKARGAIHERLHTDAYFREIAKRLRDADKVSRAEVLHTLQGIRRDLLDGILH